MNSSQFLDKQITALSGSQGGGGGDFFDLMSSQEEHHQNSSNGGGLMKKEEILPSYDFQPIRSVGSSSPPTNTASFGGGARHSWGPAADSKMSSSNLRFSSISEPHEVAKVSHEKERDAYNVATVAEIDRTVKKHADNLLHALEGVSSRLLLMESRTRNLESSVDELKVSVGNNNGSTDGKLRQLDNILREVQTGMQVLRDKQEIAEAQLQLALQASKGDHPRPENTGQLDSRQQPASQQPVQQPPHPPIAPPQPPPPPALPAPPPPLPQQNPSLVQFPAQLPQSQIQSVPDLPREPYFPLPGQTPDTTHQQYQMPAQQPQPPPPAQHYQPSPQVPQYSQPVQPPQPVNPSPQFQPPMPHQPDESAPYMLPPQSFAPSIRQPAPSSQPPSIPPPPQQYYGSNPSMYEPLTNRPGSGQLSFSAGYGPPSGPSFSEPYPYSGSPSHYSSSMKPSPFSSSAPSPGGSNYLRLPTAQILPQALPTGSSSGGGGTTGNRMPIDDVVDKVVTMGFSRDQVRATVRKLTDNGQSVDLNVVLDKLMNDGEIQPQKGWFGR